MWIRNGLTVVAVGVLAGCENNTEYDGPSHKRVAASPEAGIQTPNPVALPAGAEQRRGKEWKKKLRKKRPKQKREKKADKSRDRKHLPAGWHGDYGQALALARTNGKPLLVLFH